MKSILGAKIAMSQVFDKDGNVVPVTLVRATPNAVLQVKTQGGDGYEAVQLGFGTRKAKNVKKPQKGHFSNLGNFRHIKEFRIREFPVSPSPIGEVRPNSLDDNFQFPNIGDKIDVSIFKEGDKVKVSGISKAKGFQGVVKRHGFHGAPATHGTKHAHRQPGSIGATWPQRVIKGRRMAGRMGGGRITVLNLKVVRVDKENNLLAISGAVPGRRGTLLEIRG